MALGVGYLVLARLHVPLAHGGDDLQVGGQRLHADIEPNLVVPLAGGAVGDGRRSLFAGYVHHQLGDEGAAQGGGEGVVPLVDRAGGQGREGEVADEEVLTVPPERLGGAGGGGPLLQDIEVLLRPHVDVEGDDLVASLLSQPFDGHAGVEATGVGENNLFRHGGHLPRYVDIIYAFI